MIAAGDVPASETNSPEEGEEGSSRPPQRSSGSRLSLWERMMAALGIRNGSSLRDDLAEPANQFPADLKAALISLALWVERETQVVMGGGGTVSPLVEVNRNIIRGLSGDAGEPVAAE